MKETITEIIKDMQTNEYDCQLVAILVEGLKYVTDKVVGLIKYVIKEVVNLFKLFLMFLIVWFVLVLSGNVVIDEKPPPTPPCTQTQ